MEMVRKSRVNAFKEVFGKKPGQSLIEFAAEIKEAWTSDSAGWTALFASIGIMIEDVKTA